MKATITIDSLVGMFLHTLDKTGEIEWQGQVIEMDGDMALVQLFSWAFGEPTDVVRIPNSVLCSEDQCRLYATWDLWDAAAEEVDRRFGKARP